MKYDRAISRKLEGRKQERAETGSDRAERRLVLFRAPGGKKLLLKAATKNGCASWINRGYIRRRLHPGVLRAPSEPVNGKKPWEVHLFVKQISLGYFLSCSVWINPEIKAGRVRRQ
jgi:hypothetical protein